MLKTLGTLILLTTFLYSQNNETVKASILSEYIFALKQYKQKNYTESYQLFNKLFKNNLNDPNVNFYLGRSAFELKDYHEAIIAYERVLFEKPNNLRTKLELGRSYFLNKEYDEAKKIFKELKLTNNIPQNIIKNIDNYLSVIDSKVVRHSVNGVFIFGVNYDSNVNSKSSYDTFENVYIGGGTYLDMQNTTEDGDAWAHQEIALLNYKYKINDEITNKHDFMIFNKNMFQDKYKSKDIRLYSWKPALSIIYSPKLTVDYALFADHILVDKVNTLKTYGLLPSIVYQHDDKNIIKGYFKYQNKLNQQEIDKQKDSTVVELTTSLTNIYSNKFINTGTFTYTKEKQKNQTQIGIDKNDITLKILNTYTYEPTITFATSLSYKQTNYKDIDSSYLVKKENKLYTLGLSNTYVYNPKLIIQTSLNLIEQKSNIPTDKYNKRVFGINIIRPF